MQAALHAVRLPWLCLAHEGCATCCLFDCASVCRLIGLINKIKDCSGAAGDVDGSGSERLGTDPNGAIQCEHAGKVPKGATGKLQRIGLAEKLGLA